MAVSLIVASAALLAQSDRGSITGTVSDQAGAVVASASVEARNTETGAMYPVATSATGNYTIPELPAGTYEVSVTSAGFNRFIRYRSISDNAIPTMRFDPVALKVQSMLPLPFCVGGPPCNAAGVVNSATGLSLSNPADLATLLAPIGSAAAGRFQNKLPSRASP
jgi:hypothetical protein